MKTVTAEVFVKVPVAMAYRAFTNATALHEWLCDVATVEPRLNGRIYLWWRGDFYSSGHYNVVEENQKVSFRWFSNIDPAATEITVTFTEKDGGTLVQMDHHVPDDPDWAARAEGFRSEWQRSLENLVSVLETGIDQRNASRPMIGVYPGDFNPEQAKKLGVPVTDGFRIDGVLENMGAWKAGLQKDDVVVEIDGHEIKSDGTSFPAAIAGKVGGDSVSVTFYRGPEKKTVQMELSKRPMTEVPFDPGELAKRVRPKYQEALAALRDALDDATDAEAATRPVPQEWSALDVLAHILQGERGLQFYIVDMVSGYERTGDDWGGNVDAHMRATVAAYPTIETMLGAIERAQFETLALVEGLGPEAVADKGSFYRYGNWLLNSDSHIVTHIPQIEAAIAAARTS